MGRRKRSNSGPGLSIDDRTSTIGEGPSAKQVGEPRGRETFQRNTSRQSSAFSKVATRKIYPVERPDWSEASLKKMLLSSGTELSTYYTRDPFMGQRAEAVIRPMPQIAWGSFQVPTPGVVDTQAANAAARVLALPNQMFEVININGRFTPNQTLVTATDWSTYLNSYSQTFSILWTYLCAWKAMGINASTRSFATGMAANGLVERVAFAWDRLQLLPIPPALPKFLSELFGVFYSDAEDTVIYGYSDPNATNAVVTDWTATGTGAGTLSSLLTSCEVNLAGLEATGAEVSIINELLAVIYGAPEPLPEPKVWNDQILFDQWFCMASQYLVTANMFVQPRRISSDPGGVFPILIRKGQENSPYADRMFTFLRPQIYDAGPADAGEATTSTVGLITTTNNIASFSRYYGPGTSNNAILAETAFTALNFGNNTFYEIEWWAGFTQSTSGIASWRSDSRMYDRWERYYPNPAILGGNTIKYVDKMFFDGMKIRMM